MIKAIVLIFTLSCNLFTSNSIAADTSDIDKKIEEMFSGRENISEEQKSQLKLQFLAIMATKTKFEYRAIKEPCKKDIERFCSTTEDIEQILDCIKKNRNQASKICENSLKNTFGGNPFSKETMHAGVLLPKGSYFFYNPHGEILGAMVSKSFKYKEIEYKKGQVRFHETGLSVAHLTKDQVINGIKYKADGLGPFFDKNGNVTNATLAEDTEILGIYYKRNGQIMFNSDGTVKRGRLAKDTSINGKPYKAGRNLSYQTDGTIEVFK
jgi:hypothetical protein